MKFPYVGMRFWHRTILDGANPAMYVVTAIREGVIYYKQPLERKAKEYCTPERWPRVFGGEVMYESRV